MKAPYPPPPAHLLHCEVPLERPAVPQRPGQLLVLERLGRDGLRHGEQRQGKIGKGVAEVLDFLVTGTHLVQLKAHHAWGGREGAGDGALQWGSRYLFRREFRLLFSWRSKQQSDIPHEQIPSYTKTAPCNMLICSCSPVATAVAVAMAGMMRPAMSFALSLSTSGTLQCAPTGRVSAHARCSRTKLQGGPVCPCNMLQNQK